MLAAELTRTAADREHFQHEVRAAGKLALPNISSTAYDASELHDHFYLVLEFVDGPNLAELIRQRGPLSVPEACEFVRQIAAGLEHAHEKGMVHRDLKPENLLVSRPTPGAPLTVKIADFGIPKSTAGGPGELAIPELAGAESDPQSDLYSLGRIFYFLLTGRARAREGILPILQLRFPDVPPNVAAVLYRLLSRNLERAVHVGGRVARSPGRGMRADGACRWGTLISTCRLHPVYPGADGGYLSGLVPLPVARPQQALRAGSTSRFRSGRRGRSSPTRWPRKRSR